MIHLNILDVVNSKINLAYSQHELAHLYLVSRALPALPTLKPIFSWTLGCRKPMIMVSSLGRLVVLSCILHQKVALRVDQKRKTFMLYSLLASPCLCLLCPFPFYSFFLLLFYFFCKQSGTLNHAHIQSISYT